MEEQRAFEKVKTIKPGQPKTERFVVEVVVGGGTFTGVCVCAFLINFFTYLQKWCGQKF